MKPELLSISAGPGNSIMHVLVIALGTTASSQLQSTTLEAQSTNLRSGSHGAAAAWLPVFRPHQQVSFAVHKGHDRQRRQP